MEPMATHDFNNADNPAEQLNRCSFLFLRQLHEPRDNSLRFIVEEAKAHNHLARQVNPGLDDALAGILSGASPILSDSSSVSFEVLFDSYVSYTVTNESYGNIRSLLKSSGASSIVASSGLICSNSPKSPVMRVMNIQVRDRSFILRSYV